MNGPQHYREAEYQLAKLDEGQMRSEEAAVRMARAQAHATLALVAAVVAADELDTFEVVATGRSGLTDWGKAVRKS